MIEVPYTGERRQVRPPCFLIYLKKIFRLMRICSGRGRRPTGFVLIIIIPGRGDPGREDILRKLLQTETLPEGLSLLAPVYMDYGRNVHFGRQVFVNHGCYFMDGAEITIGDHAFIGPYCGFYTATHPLDYTRRNCGLEKESSMPLQAMGK